MVLQDYERNFPEKNLDKMYSDYIPIHIPLQHEFSRVNEDGDSLDAILSTLATDSKILFIFDALDELKETSVYQIRDIISTRQSNTLTVRQSLLHVQTLIFNR